MNTNELKSKKYQKFVLSTSETFFGSTSSTILSDASSTKHILTNLSPNEGSSSDMEFFIHNLNASRVMSRSDLFSLINRNRLISSIFLIFISSLALNCSRIRLLSRLTLSGVSLANAFFRICSKSRKPNAVRL